EPSDSIWAANALFSPWMIDTMNTTVTTPTLTPRIVNAERNLLVRTVSNAIKADSLTSMKFISLFPLSSGRGNLLGSQCFNRIQFRCAPCRPQATNHPDD